MEPSITSNLCQNHPLDLSDCGVVALVEGPLLHALSANQGGRGQDLEVFTRGRLADSQLPGNQDATYAVFHQVAVHLWREVRSRVFQPIQNLQSALIG